MRLAFLIILLAVLVGCASRTWSHSQKGQQDFYRENSQCMAMAGSGQANPMVAGDTPFARGYNQGAAMGAQANQQTIYQQCMYGNGWYLK
jgi:hypothetical protein